MASQYQEHNNSSVSATAVCVKNVAKTYRNVFDFLTRKSRPPVFSGLDLTVPTGKIYALLGLGYEGKTTLLRCITGRYAVDTGTIELFGRDTGPGKRVDHRTVGFMQQETSMFSSLTIEETLKYHGRVAGLSNVFVTHRIKLLVRHLRLPDKNKVSEKLSACEQRMLTFAIAVFQEPSLLILDEPTVSMDSITRQRIRIYLRYLVDRCSTTVMLATQMSEETNAADIVGVLADGRIVAEGTPNDVFTKFQSQSFDDICAKAMPEMLPSESDTDCHTRKKHEKIFEPDIWSDSHSKQNSPASEFIYPDINNSELELAAEKDCQADNCYKRSRYPRLSRISAEVKKNFTLLARFRVILILLIAIPGLHLVSPFVSIGTAINDIDVGYINDDNGIYGNWYLSSLDSRVLNLVEQPSFQDGSMAVTNGETIAFVYINQNFSQSLMIRYIDATSVTVDVIREGLLNLTLDSTNMQATFELLRELMTKMELLFPKTFTHIGYNSNLAAPPIKVNFVPEVLLDHPFTALIVPIQITSVLFIAQVGCSLLFLFERMRQGYCESLRSRASDLRNIEIFIGFSINQILIALVQSSVAFFIAILVFKFPVVGSMVTAGIISIFVGMSGMAFGIFLSTITDNMVVIVILGIFAPTFVSHNSGMLVPVESMPPFLKYIFKASPFYFPMDALTNVLYRGFGILTSQVMLGVTLSIIWILIFLFLACACLRIRSQ